MIIKKCNISILGCKTCLSEICVCSLSHQCSVSDAGMRGAVVIQMLQKIVHGRGGDVKCP